MKRITVFAIVLLASAMLIGASDLFYENLSNAQRYDLADAYEKVADRYEELDQPEKAADFRSMVQVIFPGFGETLRPEDEGTVETVSPARPEKPAPDPAGADASTYYFNKLLRGVFNENLSLTVSVVADPLYLPLFDSGLDKAAVTSELRWFFDEYDLTSISPADVFDLEGIETVPLDNGYWRLDVEVRPEYEDALPLVTFWSEKMGFYFRKYPEGWRLAAIGPIS